MNNKTDMEYEWVCEYCEKVFDTQEECDKHEESCKSRKSVVHSQVSTPRKMISDKKFRELRAKGRCGENFVQNIFEVSDDYKIIPFGIETRSEEVKKLLKKNYSTDTNKKIKSMPDFIVVNKNKEQAHLVEVKYFGINSFGENTQFMFNWGVLENYIKHWNEAIMFLVFSVEPYCKCVRIRDIDPSKHIAFRKKTEDGRHIIYWKFEGILKDVNMFFPGVKRDDIVYALKFFQGEMK